MNGAESLVRTLVGGGVEVCFANPGTSEMHFVAALDRVDGMRCVLCLFEGGATGAADGYARMADKPASTLLHLGPGLGNGLANLHNARRARSPVVNIVGEHATYHRAFDAPLTSDIEAIAGAVSAWVRTSPDSRQVAQDGAAAVAAARTAPGQVATLILPADTAWGEGGPVAPVPAAPARAQVDDSRIAAAAAALRSGQPAVLFLGGRAVREEGLRLADRIAAKTGVRLLAQVSNARMERGAGRVPIERLPYPVDQALAALAGTRHLIIVGTTVPVAFFAYPGKPSLLAPADCETSILAEPAEDQLDALRRLADELGADAPSARPALARPVPPTTGGLVPDTIARTLGALLPEGAIVCDESVSTGRTFFPMTQAAAPHDWLQLSGGSIGLGIPMATGAAIACPDRKVVNLQADGSGLYTAQSLWTQARENLDVLTLIWANRSYAILRAELAHVGANPGRKALDMLSLDNPPVDWVALARGYGVEARRVSDLGDFVTVLRAALARKGPFLVEVAL
ncbi:acetolactate synthase large subunit [Enterovirga sp.]|uniref:acetolactate synthase large subunit n=1 Tax=Enterovirga sp. TaxID=2026350 RepID=UPI0026164E94|nr:acetolactate synthase large subunit [Enterovirga sp.]